MKKETNNIMRLDRLLSNEGIGSRADVKKMIKNELIYIDGTVEKDPSKKVCINTQEIKANGKIINFKSNIYIMMNKPQGIVSSTFEKGKTTCIDLLTDELKRRSLFPAGRLDIDTEGLLLLTNDGVLAHNILSPKKHVWKRYFAKVSGQISEEDRNAFEKGININDEYTTQPAILKIQKSTYDEETNECINDVEVRIQEGKFHQIKRMFESLDKKVEFLKRLSMGSLELDLSLAVGEYRELNEVEIFELQRANEGEHFE